MYSSKSKKYQHFKVTLTVKNKRNEAAFVIVKHLILHYCDRFFFHVCGTEELAAKLFSRLKHFSSFKIQMNLNSKFSDVENYLIPNLKDHYT